jgi:integrating conjugative element membrane protein (TIGR03747 family)
VEYTKPLSKGVVSGAIHFVWMLICMSICAWGLLMIAFALHSFFKGDLAAKQRIHILLNSSQSFIKNNSSLRIKKAYEHFKQIETTCLRWRNIKVIQAEIRLKKHSALWQNYLPASNHRTDFHIKENLHRAVTVVWESTRLVATRLWLFILSLPLFLLCFCVGMVDGLVQRDIRKFQSARESALLFHWIKGTGLVCLVLPFFMYVVCPWPLSALWFLSPMAIVLGCVTQMGLRSFKKYA